MVTRLAAVSRRRSEEQLHGDGVAGQLARLQVGIYVYIMFVSTRFPGKGVSSGEAGRFSPKPSLLQQL